MPTVSDFGSFLNEIAPPELSESWDNTGLLVGRKTSQIRRAMTCLTITPDVATEAIHEKVQLIVSHHPVLFRAAKRISDSTTEGETLLQLIEAGIAVFSPHTAFDSACQGINQQLAQAFGLVDIRALRIQAANPAAGSGRFGKLPSPVKLTRFLNVVTVAVSADHLEYSGHADAGVLRVAVACGAAEEFLVEAIRCGCDTFVTGEARFHVVLEARARGINLILTGHFHSERPAVEQLARLLANHFPETDVFASRLDINPLTLFSGKDLKWQS